MTTVAQIAAILLVLPLLWLMRKKQRGLLQWNGFGRKQARSLQLVEQVRLTPQHSIHLVRLDDRMMVLAVDPSGCHLLGRRRRPAQTTESIRARGQGA